MEVVATVVGAVVVKTGEALCSTIKNIAKSRQQLQMEKKSLMALRDETEKEIERATQEGMEIKDRATGWLKEVDELLDKMNDQIQEEKSSRCFLSCSTKRCGISRDVAEQLKEVKRLLEVGSSIASSVAHSYPEFIAVVKIPGPSIQDQTASASEDLNQIMTLLSDDTNGIIGICGMGGVGKTNLVRNLNNKLENNSDPRFSCVLWVPVSESLDIKEVQKRIASRLCLKLEESSGLSGMATQLHRRLEKERFLLILDDVWEEIKLNVLGVPLPSDHEGCKIILTCRSLDVCRDMSTNFDFKMSVLSDKEAWELFRRSAGDVVSSEDIHDIAEAICIKFNGLPLAIKTVGAAMKGKTKPELWNDALNHLQRSVPYPPKVEEKVYKPLKWSYDLLEDEVLKNCFLYCSLFPEGFSIDISELVWCWLAEGLIDERRNYQDFFSRGIALIENLKDSCLLEDGSREGTVKMHHLVRDVSIWIASTACSEDGSKSQLVRSGNGLEVISATELSNSLKRVSFMNNDLERLPDDSVIQCSEASTLLLQNNPRLELIPGGFLERFKALRVLNISWTGIELLPISLLQLNDLRSLLLSNCKDLKKLPPLESLSKLQVLDLSWTGIIELPRGLEQLSNLRHLNLSGTYGLKVVQAGVISKLSSLEVLDLSNSYIWKLMGAEQEEQACLQEIQCLVRLRVVSIGGDDSPSALNHDDTGYSGLYFECPRVPSLSPLSGAQRCVIMGQIDLSGGQIGCWLSIASYLCLRSFRRLNGMLQDLVSNSVGRFTNLKKLVICDSDSSFKTGECAAQEVTAQDDLLPNLEELCLIKMTGIESISELGNLLGLRFQRLKKIVVIDCSKMKYLLSLGNSIRTIPNLRVIQVSRCSNLENLITYLPTLITPNLKKLELKDLPNLRNLCRHERTWPGIVQVDVIDCDLLSTQQ